MFFERLQKCCDSVNIKISSLAAVFGTSKSTITGWKNGAYPNSEFVIKASEYFNVSSDYLLGLSNERTLHEIALDLSPQEKNLLDNLRSAPPEISDAVFRMAEAALVLTDGKKRNSIFFADNDESFRHLKRISKKTGLKRVEGEAAAGLPFTTVADGERVISVPVKYLTDDYFVVQARGDSMVDANINSGDYCVFQKDFYFYDGQIMYVQLDGGTDSPDGVIKRVYIVGDRVELHSANAAYQPMVYPASDVQLLGALVLIVT